MVPAAVAAVFTVRSVDSFGLRFWATLAVLVLVPLILHRLWRVAFPAYRTWSNRSLQITTEIEYLEEEPLTSLIGIASDERESTLKKPTISAAGPFANLKRRYPSECIGNDVRYSLLPLCALVSPFVSRLLLAHPSAAQRPTTQPDGDRPNDFVAKKSGNIIIIQSTMALLARHPLNTKASASLKSLLGPCGSRLRSLIICWNGIREWKI